MSYNLDDLSVVDAVNLPVIQREVLSYIDDVVLKENHHNSTNYANMGPRIQRYMSFPVLFLRGEIVGFAGMLQDDHFPSGTARIFDRHYIGKPLRRRAFPSTDGYLLRDPNMLMSTRKITPLFREVAEQHNLDGIFYSVQTPKKRRVVTWLLELQHELGHPFELLDGLYFTCPHDKYDDKTCWQNIALLRMSDDCEFDMPRIEIDEWYNI